MFANLNIHQKVQQNKVFYLRKLFVIQKNFLRAYVNFGTSAKLTDFLENS